MINSTGYVVNPSGETALGAQQKWNAQMSGLAAQGLNREWQDYDRAVSALKSNPVNLVAGNLMNEQAKMIEGYQQKWADEYQKYKGRLPMNLEVERENEKNALAVWQQQKLGDYQRFLSDQNVLDKDYDMHFDKQHAAQVQKYYMETGQYPPDGMLKPVGIDVIKYLQGIKPDAKIKINKIETQKGDHIYTDITEDYDLKDKQATFLDDLHRNPKLQYAVADEFTKMQTKPEQSAIFDDYMRKANGNIGAAVEMFGVDKYAPYVGGGGKESHGKTLSHKGGGLFIGIGSHANDPNALQATNAVFNGTPLSQYYDFGKAGVSFTVKGANIGNVTRVEEGQAILDKDQKPITKNGEVQYIYPTNKNVSLNLGDDYQVIGFDKATNQIVMQKIVKLGSGVTDNSVYLVPLKGNENVLKNHIQNFDELMGSSSVTNFGFKK